MKTNYIYIATLVLITGFACQAVLDYGFYSIDEESYTQLTRSIAKHGQFDFETDYQETYSQLSRPYFSVIFNGRTYSVFPPGYPILAVPFYLVFGLKGMQIANVFFTILLIITFYLFVKEYYPEKEAFTASIFLLLGTQILNYSVSLWSHIPAAFFMLLSIYLLFKNRYLLAGVLIGAGTVIRYTSVLLLPFYLIYVYNKDRQKIWAFIASFIIGITPLLFYNYVSFGSPFISAMSILNAEEGYRTFNLLNIPKSLVTNILHYTFFPEIEFFTEKSSLLETSPFFVFSILGVYLFWRDKKKNRLELFTLVASVLLFFLFVSGTWSLGGLAHNMRLLTDIIPVIAFLSLIPLFYLKNHRAAIVSSILFLGLSYFWDVTFEWLKFYNALISVISFLAIFALIVLKKDFSSGRQRTLFSLLLSIGIGMSVLTAVFVTSQESMNRKGVREAAQTFEKNIPEGSVVFVFLGDYPMYTEKEYIFLDYSHGYEDLPRVIAHYQNKSKYVLFKDPESVKKFASYELMPSGPIRTYQIVEKEDGQGK